MVLSGDKKAYLAAERRRNRRAVKIVCVIAAATLVVYMVSAPFYLEGPQQKIILTSIALMLATVVSYWAMVGSPIYQRVPWIDIPFFLAAYLCQLGMNYAFFPSALSLGSSPSELVTYNSAVFVITASVAVVASPLSFAALAGVILVVCTAVVHWLGWPIKAQLGQLMPFFTATVVALYANYTIDAGRKRAYFFRKSLEQQKEKSDTLLYNLLPKDVARRLKSSETVADAFSEVSVIFIDIVEFSQMTRRLSPKHLVDILNVFFSIADECADRAGAEKVKTIGDAYLGVTGATLPTENCAVCAIEFALSVIEALGRIAEKTGETIQVRIGIHTGSVVGGVIGSSRKAYDYWGDTMNVASRIQGSAAPNSVLVSETTYNRAKKSFAFGVPGLAALKGVGEVKVYEAFPPTVPVGPGAATQDPLPTPATPDLQ